MTEVLHANVFFFITAVAVIILTMLACVALYHVIKILKSIRNIVARIEKGSETVAEDMSQLRKYFSEGSFVSNIIGIFVNRFNPLTRTRQKNSERHTSRKNAEKTPNE